MYKDPFGREHRYAPPAGWVRKDGTIHFNADEDWQRLCAQGLAFPDYRGPARLFGVRGDCLEPLVTSQHMVRQRPVAPDEPLIDGGLYVMELGASAENSEAAAYREKHGIAPGEKFVIMKFLRWIGDEWYAQCKDSVLRLSEYGAVIAMVVAVLPLAGCAPSAEVHARQSACGNPFDAQSAECAQVSPNAATTSLIANNSSGSGGTITGVSGLLASGFVIHPSGPGFDCTAVVTATIGVQQTAGTLGDVKVLVRFADDGSTYSSATQEVPINSATLQPYTLQWEFAHSKANAGVGTVQIYFDVGSTSDAFAWNTASLQIEYLIR